MPRKGERHHNARLSDKQVEAMRVLYATNQQMGNDRGYGHYARLFRCGRMTARDIILKRTRCATDQSTT